jgi:hypothetical protein
MIFFLAQVRRIFDYLEGFSIAVGNGVPTVLGAHFLLEIVALY